MREAVVVTLNISMLCKEQFPQNAMGLNQSIIFTGIMVHPHGGRNV
ncbi:hypothetical protein PARPLA_00362 [Rhodobacteraceae bacterium THAF1]|nr:hypothetical protein FIU81_15450 [Palleronia sp. THAF1]VDC17022.1 hypothetical protein PARPLA_00362 [Rhodobacteraceae bacterium THAF1]